MPRYFFDLHDGLDSFDESGTELADLQAVHKHMLFLAIKIMTGKEHNDDSWCIEALNENGSIVATVDFDIKTGRLS